MRLTHRLTLAFLVVSLTAIGLAALFVWVTTSTEFSQYLIDQRQSQFVAAASDYYLTHSSWAGVDSALRSQGLLPPGAQPGAKPPDPQPYALVDQDGVVVIAAGDYQTGQKVQPSVVAAGIEIESGGRSVGAVLTTGQTPARSALENTYLNGVNESLLVAALGGGLVAFALGLLVARSLSRPLRDLTDAARSVAEGRLGQSVAVRTGGELGELARAFNQMSADLALANQSRRQMTADIAHDLRNPLTVIGGYLESLQDGKLEPTPERFETMNAEVRHLQSLVDDLRTLSLADAGDLALRKETVAPGEMLDRVAAAYAQRADQAGLRLVVEARPRLPEAHLDVERMEQVLRNLVDNGIRHTPAGGEIRLAAGQSEGNLVLTVADTGSGISPEALPHVFERSYGADQSRSGNESGLGLAIAKSIVELHGGSIRAESTPGDGSRFVVVIPG
jgi:signal transduction histidine kinase